MAASAILLEPDFFKVAVSKSGNHDNSLYYHIWNERYGPVTESKDESGETAFLSSSPTNNEIADNLKGIDTFIMGMGRDEDIVKDGHNYYIGKSNVLVSHVVTRWDASRVGQRDQQNDRWLRDDIILHTPEERPAFIMVHPVSWSYFPSNLTNVSKMLGDEYIAVSPDHFRKLYDFANKK